MNRDRSEGADNFLFNNKHVLRGQTDLTVQMFPDIFASLNSSQAALSWKDGNQDQQMGLQSATGCADSGVITIQTN